ncbi:MAG: hypothetical protein QM736_17365 [Vicinamibacterales bacterium]
MALITGRVSRSTIAGSSSPWNCTSAQPYEVGDVVDAFHRLVDEHTDRRHERRQRADDRACGIGIDPAPALRPEENPTADAPQSTATCASLARVMPQIFTSIMLLRAAPPAPRWDRGSS